MGDTIDPLDILQTILNSITAQVESKEEIIKHWFHIGNMMGIDHIFPEMHVIVTPDEEGIVHPIILVGSIHPLVIDHLTEPKIIKDEILEVCLEKIKEMKAVMH